MTARCLPESAARDVVARHAPRELWKGRRAWRRVVDVLVDGASVRAGERVGVAAGVSRDWGRGGRGAVRAMVADERGAVRGDEDRGMRTDET